MKEINKDEKIKKEIRMLNKIFKDIDKNKYNAVKSLIDNTAFMSVTLEELQESINKNGVISEYQNGENQWGTKKSPEIEIYNTMIKNYSTAVKQLIDLLPKNESEKDELTEFLMGVQK